MGILNLIQGSRVYLDTNVFIYALEGYAAFRAHLTDLFGAIDRGDLKAVTSELTLAEVLVRPFIQQNEAQQQLYAQMLRTSESLATVPITREILIEAARLRATSDLRLPDAIHVATAHLTGCETLVTNDLHLNAAPGIAVVLLSHASSD
jgi:predicted nucleic acid-binding protein